LHAVAQRILPVGRFCPTTGGKLGNSRRRGQFPSAQRQERDHGPENNPAKSCRAARTAHVVLGVVQAERLTTALSQSLSRPWSADRDPSSRTFGTRRRRRQAPSQSRWLTTQMLAIYRQPSIPMHEVVKYTGRLHGVVFLRRVLIVLPVLAFAPILWAIAIGGLVAWLALLRQESTKIVVTNRRVIIRRGMRRTVHITVQQIEGVDVTRTYLGMILNYGTVTIRGAGGSREQVEAIADPFRLQDRLAYAEGASARITSD